jgi:succinate-semialdehyde dehydrogenase / glutarate-semialdehyde dehydrogenase
VSTRRARVDTRTRMINNGRSFVAARRFIVHEDVNDAFIDSFVEAMRPLKIGDTMEAGTDIGPPATGRASVAERVDGAPARGPGHRCTASSGRLPASGSLQSRDRLEGL